MNSPPPYTEKQQQPLTSNPTPQQTTNQHPTSRFPQTMLIEKASFSDMTLAVPTEHENTQPLYYVSTHGGFSSKPSVVLHSGPQDSTPFMSTADFKSFSSTTNLSAGSETSELFKDGIFSRSHSFTVQIPLTRRSEMFEWKRSSGPEVSSLGLRSSGLKCVRVSTGEVVAVFAGVLMSMSKKGKMGFVGSGAKGDLGGNWDLMAVISLLALLERARRSSNSAAGGGAAGGGGGC